MIQITKLNEIGDHLILIGVFILLFGVAGTFWLIEEHAATPTYVELQLANDRSYCLTDAMNIGSCSASDSNDLWDATLTGSNFHIMDHAGQCIDDWNGTVNSTAARMNTCYSGDAHQEWNWSGSAPSELVNATSKGCINNTGDADKNGNTVIIYACANNKSPKDAEWYETSVSSGGGSSSGTTSAIGSELMTQAEKFNGIPYAYGGGHNWSTFLASCLGGNRTTKPSTASSCQVDCSGLISMATNMALGTSYTWFVGSVNGTWEMEGTGASNWVQIPLSSVAPGDIVTGAGSGDGHVEFVYSGTGSNIKTFGAHYTGVNDGVITPSTENFFPTSAYRYE